MLRGIIYLILSLAIIFYGLPRLEVFSDIQGFQVFSIAWIVFALLVVGAHLDYLLILDEEKRKRTNQLKRYKLWRKEQQILNLQSKRLKANE